MTASTLRRPASFWHFDGTASGASGQAARLPNEHRNWLRGFADGSATGTDQIGGPIHSIIEVQRQCSKDNWDGAGAKAIGTGAARHAEKVLLSLPSYLPVPDIYGDPTGAITFEWYRRPNHRFVLSIYDNRRLEYAALLGVDTEAYGAARMGSELPAAIRDHLRQLFTD